MGGGAFIPRFRNLKKEEKRDFIKGYCVIINSGGSAAPTLFADYGEALQKKVDSLCRVVRLRQHLRRAPGALRESRADQ